jgi:hypothetical protein
MRQESRYEIWRRVEELNGEFIVQCGWTDESGLG